MPFENKFFSLLFSLLIYSLLLFGFAQHSAYSHKIDSATKEILVSLEFVSVEQELPRHIETVANQVDEKVEESATLNIPKVQKYQKQAPKIKHTQANLEIKKFNPNETVGHVIGSSQKSKIVEAPEEVSIETTHDNDVSYEEIRALIKEHLKYPSSAKKLEQEGVAELFFVLGEDGLKELYIVRSSGYASLDKAAIKAIEDALSALPTIKKEMKISLPIVFEISN